MSTYNGYSNYETWNMVVWIDNEEQPNQYKLKCLSLLFEGDNINSHSVKQICLELYPDGTPDMNGNQVEMDRVNYEEIAELWAEEAKDL